MIHELFYLLFPDVNLSTVVLSEKFFFVVSIRRHLYGVQNCNSSSRLLPQSPSAA